jgi:putative ABC transport system permease protein
LVILSIAVGVAAIGVVAGTYLVFTRDLFTEYQAINPAHATLFVSAFDEELLRIIRNLPGVENGEGRFEFTAQVKVGADEWRNLKLIAISDFNNIQINKINPTKGEWPPGYRGILIERTSLPITRSRIGDSILVKTQNGIERDLKIVGLAHDLNIPSGTFTNQITGYIDFDTLEWLGYQKAFNQLLLISEGENLTRRDVRDLSYIVEEKIEKGGRTVYATTIPQPGRHWFVPFMTPIASALIFIGVVILTISGLLIVNTISAILSQQTRQIGIMKAVGARGGQILSMYLVSMLTIGILAFLIALPISVLGMRWSVKFLASLINFDIMTPAMPSQVMILQGIISIILPILVTIIPIYNASRMTVRVAISDYGLNKVRFGETRFDRLIGSIKGLSRPFMLSLRNTFRRKTRLVFTLITLSLGSAIFIGVMSAYGSLIRTLDEALNYYGFDLIIFFSKEYRIEQILGEMARNPEVDKAETWGVAEARIVNLDGSESSTISFVAPPVNTKLIKPSVVKGRWLLPEDENAIVINSDVLMENPELDVGDLVKLKIDGSDSIWKIAGITRSVMTGPSMYANYPYFARRLGRYGVSTGVYIALDQHDPASQRRMGKILEEQLESSGLRVNTVNRVSDLRFSAIRQFNIILLFLLLMTLILTFVGGLGLTGTMSLNVIERIREIGILRAIGASSKSILQIVVFEGIIIGLISWFFGLFLSLPIITILNNIIGYGFLKSPLIRVFSYPGAVIWLFLVIFLAGIASLLPAINATRVTVRDVLAYE